MHIALVHFMNSPFRSFGVPGLPFSRLGPHDIPKAWSSGAVAAFMTREGRLRLLQREG